MRYLVRFDRSGSAMCIPVASLDVGHAWTADCVKERLLANTGGASSFRGIRYAPIQATLSRCGTFFSSHWR
jgi:hypothetical protein